MSKVLAEANSAAIARQAETRRSEYRLAAIVVLALAARVSLMLPNAQQPLEDPDNYMSLARSLVEGGGFAINGRPTAYRPPLYALALTPIVAVGLDRTPWGIWSFHLALGGTTVALTAIAARRVGLSRRGVLIAAAIVAFDPVLVAQARTAMTETFAAFWVAAILAALGRRGGPTFGKVAIAGSFCGLLALCRPSLLPCAGLIAGVLLISTKSSIFQRLARSIIFSSLILLVMSPWAVREARVFGEAIWTSSHGGYTLAMANNEVYYREILDGPKGAVWGGRTLFEWRREITLATQGMTEPRQPLLESTRVGE